MKFPTILSIIFLGIGIAIGWIAKPTPATPEAAIAKIEPPKISDRKESKPTPPSVEKSERKVTVIGGNQPGQTSEENQAQVDKIQSQMSKMMQKRQQKKLEARISKLVAQLNLSPEQEAALRKAAAENQIDAGSIMSGDFDPSKLASLNGDGALEEALADILTDEQKEEHEALKKRELANKVESKALKNLAKLGSLDMSQEQKDAAYDILYKQAEESTTNEDSPANGIFSAVTESFGIEIDADDFGIDFGAMGAEAASGGEVPNQQDIMARMKEGQQKKIDEKVEALRPVLNDDQLDQYRQSLEIKQSGFLGGIMSGFGESAEEDE